MGTAVANRAFPTCDGKQHYYDKILCMAAMHKQIRSYVGMSGTMQMWHFMWLDFWCACWQYPHTYSSECVQSGKNSRCSSKIIHLVHSACSAIPLPPSNPALHWMPVKNITSAWIYNACKCTEEVESTALHPPSFNIEWNAFLQHVATLFRYYYWIHLEAYEYGVKEPVTFRVFKIHVSAPVKRVNLPKSPLRTIVVSPVL